MDMDIQSERARSDRLGVLALKASMGELGPAKRLGAMGASALGSLGSAALLAAGRGGHEHCARALLPSADPMEPSKSSDGRLAMSWAIHHGWEDFAVELAMASGPRANEKIAGVTPLMSASKSGMAKLCRMLAKDAPPLERDADGCTALMWACVGNQAVRSSILASEQAAHVKAQRPPIAGPMPAAWPWPAGPAPRSWPRRSGRDRSSNPRVVFWSAKPWHGPRGRSWRPRLRAAKKLRARPRFARRRLRA